MFLAQLSLQLKRLALLIKLENLGLKLPVLFVEPQVLQPLSLELLVESTCDRPDIFYLHLGRVEPEHERHPCLDDFSLGPVHQLVSHLPVPLIRELQLFAELLGNVAVPLSLPQAFQTRV